METTPGRQPVAPRPPRVAPFVGAYLLLFVLGVMEALIGCFQYSRGLGPVPVGAIVSSVAIFATCLLAGLGMGSAFAGLAAAVGWLLMSMLLVAFRASSGSVIVTATAAGEIYLYGGAVAAALGTVLATRARPRAGR